MKQTIRLAALLMLVALVACDKTEDEPCIPIPYEETIPKVIAHRGLHRKGGAAENSIAALKAAGCAGLYASEFDVHLTRDNVPVVFHDYDVRGLHIQESTYKTLYRKVKLANGERLPTLRQYLEAAQPFKKMRLVLEIKPHATAERNREAVCVVVQEVCKAGLADRTDYIAADIELVKALRIAAPNADVSFIKSDSRPYHLRRFGLTGAGYHYNSLLKNRDWVNEALRFNLRVNVWTVNDTALIREMVHLGVDYITTDEPLIARQFIASLCKE